MFLKDYSDQLPYLTPVVCVFLPGNVMGQVDVFGLWTDLVPFSTAAGQVYRRTVKGNNMGQVDVFELCFTFTLWTDLVPFSTAAGLQTDGKVRPRVVGASQPVVAVLGDDVILPCHVEPQRDVEEMTVEWWRPDVPPDPEDPLSNYRYVHRYHDKRHEEDMKNPAYAGRTALFSDGLRHGNISLKIRDVRRSDRGRYRCQVLHLASAAVIKLNVEPGSVKTTLRPGDVQTPDPSDEPGADGGGLFLSVVIGGLAACVLLILAVGAGRYSRHKRPGNPNQPRTSDSSSSGSEELGS